jgi:hypothetical protein
MSGDAVIALRALVPELDLGVEHDRPPGFRGPDALYT